MPPRNSAVVKDLQRRLQMEEEYSMSLQFQLERLNNKVAASEKCFPIVHFDGEDSHLEHCFMAARVLHGTLYIAVQSVGLHKQTRFASYDLKSCMSWVNVVEIQEENCRKKVFSLQFCDMNEFDSKFYVFGDEMLLQTFLSIIF